MRHANFAQGRKDNQKIAIVTLCESFETRHEGRTIAVKDKREARKIAEAQGYRPWNF